MIIPRRSILGCKGEPESSWDLPQAQRHRLHAVSERAAGVAGRPFRVLARVSGGRRHRQMHRGGGIVCPGAHRHRQGRRHWERNFDLLMRTVDAEDSPSASTSRKASGAGAQKHITFGRNEPALGHYHKSLQEALA
jgi:hypothetical protein